MATTKAPKEPAQDPSAPKRTKKDEADQKDGLGGLPRRKREAALLNPKVAPRYAFSVELDPADGYIYGPFDIEATDETDAKRQVLDQYPAIKTAITKLQCKIVKTDATPTNWDSLSEDQKKRFVTTRRRMGLPVLDCESDVPKAEPEGGANDGKSDVPKAEPEGGANDGKSDGKDSK